MTLTKDNYQMQSSTVSLTMTTPGPFAVLFIKRSDSTFNAAVSVKIIFQAGPPMLSPSDKMRVRLRKSQVTIKECSAITATHSTGSLVVTLLTDHSDYCDLEVTLSFCPCVNLEVYSLVLSNGLTNPSNNNG